MDALTLVMARENSLATLYADVYRYISVLTPPQPFPRPEAGHIMEKVAVLKSILGEQEEKYTTPGAYNLDCNGIPLGKHVYNSISIMDLNYHILLNAMLAYGGLYEEQFRSTQ